MAPGKWPAPAAVAAALLILLAANPSPAFAADRDSEYQVKAAFLVNFARFVEWPPQSFGAANDPLVFGVYGNDLFGAALDQAVSGKMIGGRLAVIRRTSEVGALRSCHVVFLPASEINHFRELSNSLGNLSVLLVGETEGFAEGGGVINFILENERVRFEISPSAAARVHLKISSKLLQLAVIVGGK
jgi:YfiR/HmsC-like